MLVVMCSCRIAHLHLIKMVLSSVLGACDSNFPNSPVSFFCFFLSLLFVRLFVSHLGENKA